MGWEVGGWSWMLLTGRVRWMHNQAAVWCLQSVSREVSCSRRTCMLRQVDGACSATGS
jgi:hypothetical protein